MSFVLEYLWVLKNFKFERKIVVTLVTIAYNINTDKNLVCICTLIFGLVARPGSTKWRVRHPPFSYGEIDERIKFEPEGNKIKVAAITVALAFATFENVCYLIQNGTDRFSFIFFRGFGTGAMHVLCGLIVGGGLAYTWRRTWLKIAGTCGLLGATITLHAIYNLLIAYGGVAQYIAYALPVLLVAAGRLSTFRLSRRK